jgi:hypothetical protein
LRKILWIALAILAPAHLSSQSYSPAIAILYETSCGIGCNDPYDLGHLGFTTYDGITVSGEYQPYTNPQTLASGFEDIIVIYIDSRDGGFASNSSFTDHGDGSDLVRASISGVNGFLKSSITFPPGFLADFAVVIAKDPQYNSGVYELNSNAPHVFVDDVNLTPDDLANPTIYFFEFDFDEVDSQTGIKFVATYVDPFDAPNVQISKETYGLSSQNCFFTCNTVFHTYNQYEARAQLTGSPGWRLLSFPESCANHPSTEEALYNLWTSGVSHSDDEDGAPNIFRAIGVSGPNIGMTPVTSIDCFSSTTSGAIAIKVNGDDNGGPGLGTWPKTLRLFTDDYLRGTMLPWAGSLNEWTSGTEWTLSGNPFAATIDWDDVQFGSNVSTSVWLWNNATQTYDTYNQGNGNVIGGLIAPFEGYWVQYNGPDNGILIPVDAQTTGGIFRGKEADAIRLVVRVTDSEGSNTSWVAFNANASTGLDPFDTEKLTPLSDSYLQVYTMVNGLAHDINVQPLTASGFLQMDLGITSTRGGTQTLDFAEFMMPDGWSAYLFDKLTQQTHQLNANFSLPLNSPMGKALPMNERSMVLTDANPRFTLIVDPADATSTEDDGRGTMDEFALEQNYPNPFNPSTVIGFQLSVAGKASLKVYDMLGREVAVLVNGTMPAGSHTATFDASNLTSGVYVYKLEAGGQVMTKRMTLVK